MKFKFSLIIFLLVLSCLVSPALSDSHCNIIAHPSETTILWDYSSCSNVLNASVDSYTIFGFDATSGTYVLRDLESNQTHKFTLYDNPYGYYSSTASTLKPASTAADKTSEIINVYLFFFIALICIIISVWVKPVAFIALTFSVLGLAVVSIGADNNFYMMVVYGLMLVVSVASLGY